MKSTKFVSKRNDAQLVSFFSDVARLIGAATISIHTTGQTKAFNLPVDDTNSDCEWIRNSKLQSVVVISATVSRVHIFIDRRPGQNSEATFDLSLFDALIFNVTADSDGNTPLGAEGANAVSQLIEDVFGQDISTASAAFKDPKSFQTVLRSHQQIIERLQQMTLEVGEQATVARRKLDEEYIALKKTLEEGTAEQRRQSQEALDAQLENLTERADAIAARAKALDDRDNTHVRRELHEKLKARLADRFKKLDLTPETKGARLPIHVGVAATGIILAVLIFWFTREALSVTARTDSTTAERILAIAKSATASLGFLGILSWYLRWMNRWFERLADSEFQLKQFELDITRAQWVVETAFEWKMSQQSPIPDQLLENISRNLFVGSEKDGGADMHPADYLASALIGKASNVKLAVPGAEIELGPKALKGASI
ncbi:hypothetical protein [Rhizobium laguerreae]|uniref:hypothetical protein n=1 Tax=Rhizobium laguerreae TaxID=1076926 RepID=UPI001C923642|nr:hypothetical protein [Rhizobium laguerreae]MBY3199128.1 hypothetical protein [Rhizobium laguerreae]MBY3334454.1 hypothetical protein [Rhizobium laguerreae]